MMDQYLFRSCLTFQRLWGLWFTIVGAKLLLLPNCKTINQLRSFGLWTPVQHHLYWRSLAHGSPGPGSNIPQIIYFADLINHNDSPPVLHTKYFGIILNRAYLVPRPWLMWHSCWLGHGVEYYKASCCQYCLLEVKMSRSVRRVFVKTAIIILRSSVLKVLFTQSPCQHEKDGNNRARLKLFF